MRIITFICNLFFNFVSGKLVKMIVKQYTACVLRLFDFLLFFLHTVVYKSVDIDGRHIFASDILYKAV